MLLRGSSKAASEKANWLLLITATLDPESGATMRDGGNKMHGHKK
jgi:hypothetical protein